MIVYQTGGGWTLKNNSVPRVMWVVVGVGQSWQPLCTRIMVNRSPYGNVIITPPPVILCHLGERWCWLLQLLSANGIQITHKIRSSHILFLHYPISPHCHLMKFLMAGRCEWHTPLAFSILVTPLAYPFLPPPQCLVIILILGVCLPITHVIWWGDDFIGWVEVVTTCTSCHSQCWPSW